MMLALSTIMALLAFALLALASIGVARNTRRIDGLAAYASRLVFPAARPPVVEAVAAWWRRRLTGIGFGIILGAAVATAYVWWLGADRGRPAVDLVVVGAVVGGVLGAASRSVVRRRQVGNTSAAHSRSLRLADFTPRWLRYAARASVAFALVLTLAVPLVALISPRYGYLSIVPTPFSILVVLGLAALVRFEVVGRAIVRQPTSASSADGLTADTVLRCLALRDLALTATVVSVLGGLLTLPEFLIVLESTLPTPAAVNTFNATVAVLALAAAALTIFAPASLQPVARPAMPAREGASQLP